MAKRSQQGNPAEVRATLNEILNSLDEHFDDLDLRVRVKALIPVFQTIRKFGSSLQPPGLRSGKARLLDYLRRYKGELIDGEELMVVSGIGEWARRVRQLRVEEGWPILSGVTVAELTESLRE